MSKPISSYNFKIPVSVQYSYDIDANGNIILKDVIDVRPIKTQDNDN